MGNDEWRTVPRHELNVEVTYESRHDFHTGLAQDLGSGGIFVAAPILRPVGECVRVRFTLPDSPVVLDAIAEVRWLRVQDSGDGEAGMGLQFLQMSAPTKEAVKSFIEKRAATPDRTGQP